MAKPWPHDTFEKLHAAGYTYVEPSPCAAPECQKIIFWFKTPKGHLMPMERLDGPEARYQPHFASCPEARNFSRKEDGTIERRKAS